jgi:hypothetical protein
MPRGRSLLSWAVAVALLAPRAAAQAGSKYRCRDRDPQCPKWQGMGECANNHAFMAESCPRSCGYCENAGLLPTPAVFQLDFVCNDQLAIAPEQYKGVPTDNLPDGCGFRCRNNMTLCSSYAAQGMCESHAEVMRFQCPEECGVCKGIGLVAGQSYPRHACMHTSPDLAHASQLLACSELSPSVCMHACLGYD